MARVRSDGGSPQSGSWGAAGDEVGTEDADSKVAEHGTRGYKLAGESELQSGMPDFILPANPCLRCRAKCKKLKPRGKKAGSACDSPARRAKRSMAEENYGRDFRPRARFVCRR
ncbi:hypothetical protein KM043_009874 [Ampulex compressa]|nr:hypothetical protein KM043_009874 [Ampulex compressa]